MSPAAPHTTAVGLVVRRYQVLLPGRKTEMSVVPVPSKSAAGATSVGVVEAWTMRRTWPPPAYVV